MRREREAPGLNKDYGYGDDVYCVRWTGDTAQTDHLVPSKRRDDGRITGPDATVTVTSTRQLSASEAARYRDREGRIKQWQQLAAIGQAYRGLL